MREYNDSDNLDTRTGDPQGKAIERKTADSTDGQKFATRIVEQPDGELMLRTRNGWREFSFKKKESPALPCNFVETAYTDRAYKTFQFASDYIPWFKFADKIKLIGSYEVVFAEYPAVAASSVDYTKIKVVSITKEATFSYLVAKQFRLLHVPTGVYKNATNVSVIEYFPDEYTTAYKENSPVNAGPYAVRAKRGKRVSCTIDNETVVICLKPPDTSVESTGLSPFDQVVFAGMPWHGFQVEPDAYPSGAPQATVLLSDGTSVDVPRVGYPSAEYIKLQGSAGRTASSAENSEGISWPGHFFANGIHTRSIGGVSFLKWCWLFCTADGVTWRLRFEPLTVFNPAVPDYGVMQTYSYRIMARKHGLLEYDGEAEIQIYTATETSATALPFYMWYTLGFSITASPDGSRMTIQRCGGSDGDFAGLLLDPLLSPSGINSIMSFQYTLDNEGYYDARGQSTMVRELVFGGENAPEVVSKTTLWEGNALPQTQDSGFFYNKYYRQIAYTTGNEIVVIAHLNAVAKNPYPPSTTAHPVEIHSLLCNDVPLTTTTITADIDANGAASNFLDGEQPSQTIFFLSAGSGVFALAHASSVAMSLRIVISTVSAGYIYSGLGLTTYGEAEGCIYDTARNTFTPVEHFFGTTRTVGIF